MEAGNVIQIVAIIVTAGTAIVALVIASMDRRNAVWVAEYDRRVAIEQARLLAELEASVRLSVLEARAGHKDPVISRDMAAEALALVAMLGPERVPEMWKRRVAKTDEELRACIADESKPQYIRDAVEAERAVHSILDELRSLRS